MKPPAAGNPAGLNAPALLLSWGGTLSGFLLYRLRLAGAVLLFLLPAAQVIVQVFIPVIVVGEVTNASGKLDFQIMVRFPSCFVIVEQAVDAFISVQRVNGFGNIGYRINPACRGQACSGSSSFST